MKKPLPKISSVVSNLTRREVLGFVSGTVFLTVYPGWYPGRTVHIHFKIRSNSASQLSYEFTSQLYFEDAITDRVHAQKPYNARGQRTVKNNRDGIFQQGGDRLMLQLSQVENGYRGKFDIGLELS